MIEKNIFYYRFKKNNTWTLINILLFILVSGIFVYKPFLFICCSFARFSIPVFILSYGLWRFKYCQKHIMAVTTKDFIRIDSCNPLYWKDIESAEIKTIRCCLLKRDIIVLHPKANITYKYNFLQKHNGDFTAFSLPLYDIITQEDIDALKNILKTHIKKTNF